jgi:hypothetical protein
MSQYTGFVSGTLNTSSSSASGVVYISVNNVGNINNVSFIGEICISSEDQGSVPNKDMTMAYIPFMIYYDGSNYI